MASPCTLKRVPDHGIPLHHRVIQGKAWTLNRDTRMHSDNIHGPGFHACTQTHTARLVDCLHAQVGIHMCVGTLIGQGLETRGCSNVLLYSAPTRNGIGLSAQEILNRPRPLPLVLPHSTLLRVRPLSRLSRLTCPFMFLGTLSCTRLLHALSCTAHTPSCSPSSSSAPVHTDTRAYAAGHRRDPHDGQGARSACQIRQSVQAVGDPHAVGAPGQSRAVGG
jgi:hypothetical protein